MRATRLFLFLLVLCFFSTTSFAQEEDKGYVIQLATFGSWEEMVAHKSDFDMYMSAYAEKVGNKVKVYLLHYNSDYGFGTLYYPGESLNQDYKRAKKNHKGAFRRSDVREDNLILAWDAFEKYKDKAIPSEYTTKGVESGEVSSEGASKYKIQLGAFKEQKSLDYIADRYGLTEAEKGDVEELLTHDFKKIKKVICRRYFFGEFINKQDALTKKKALEKKTNRKLILVKE